MSDDIPPAKRTLKEIASAATRTILGAFERSSQQPDGSSLLDANKAKLIEIVQQEVEAAIAAAQIEAQGREQLNSLRPQHQSRTLPTSPAVVGDKTAEEAARRLAQSQQQQQQQ